MRVLVIGPDEVANGSTRVVSSWIAMLHALGHQIDHVVNPWFTTLKSVTAPAAVRVFRPVIDRQAPVWRRFQSFALPAARLARELHQERPYDLMITHFTYQTEMLRQLVPTAKLLATWHSPVIDEDYVNSWIYGSRFRRMTYPLRRQLFAASERRALQAADWIHTLSQYTWSLLNQHYPALCQASRWRQIPGTFDSTRFAPAADRQATRRQLGFSDDELVLLAIRRLVPRNAPERLITAAKALRDAGIAATLLIGSSGELRDSLAQQIGELGLQDRVRLIGHVAESQLPAYFQAADATLLPTRNLEGFGLPVIESLACGTPCLATPVGSPVEILSDTPQFLASANSGQAFAELVRRFAAGELSHDRDALARRAYGRYGEPVIQQAVGALVEEIGRTPR